MVQATGKSRVLQNSSIQHLERRPIAERVVHALTAVLGPPVKPLALHEPRLHGREWAYVKDCLDSGWVSSVGQYVSEFERRLSEICGVRHAVATVNGTAALQVALLVAGVGRTDEVIVPTLSFVATANAVAHCGAVPHFADSQEETLGVDPVKLRDYLARIAEIRGATCFNRTTGHRISAVVPMHTFGHPVDMDALLDVAARYRLTVIEDATEALGSRYKGRAAGSIGRLGTLSFNGNKIITTGGGGAILTDDDELARRARHLTTTAKKPHRWSFDHDEVGYNYRLPNINAALGCAQLEQLDGFVRAKRRLAERYKQAFSEVHEVRFFEEPRFATSNYWLNAILLDEGVSAQRDDVLAATNDAGFMTRPAWTPLHRLPMYAQCPSMDLATAERIERCLINLPSSAILGEPGAP